MAARTEIIFAPSNSRAATVSRAATMYTDVLFTHNTRLNKVPRQDQFLVRWKPRARPDYYAGVYTYAIWRDHSAHYLEQVAPYIDRICEAIPSADTQIIAISRLEQWYHTTGQCDAPPIAHAFDPHRHCARLAASGAGLVPASYEVILTGPVCFRPLVPGGGVLDLVALRAAVLARATHINSRLHGPAHWDRVSMIGRQLIADGSFADGLVVSLFGLFHDAMRVHDGNDPDHGRRGAVLAYELLAGVLDPGRLALLAAACAGHADGKTSTDLTIGTCWDADRLDLWRVGIRPDPVLLSTPQAPGRIDWARDLPR